MVTYDQIVEAMDFMFRNHTVSPTGSTALLPQDEYEELYNEDDAFVENTEPGSNYTAGGVTIKLAEDRDTPVLEKKGVVVEIV